MNSVMNDILLSLEKEDYQTALTKCEKFVSDCLTSFMVELTINRATDFAGSTLLYAKICAMIKKPWKCIPKLDSAQGALRFMEDFIADKSVLSQAFHSFAEAYERAGFLPETVSAYYKEALYAVDKEACIEALSPFFYYLEQIGDDKNYDLSSFYERFSEQEVKKIKEEACAEAQNRILTDPVETTPSFLKIRYELESRVDEILTLDNADATLFCVRYWNTKKKVLKEEFSIEWRSPEEMNPQIRFY